MRGQRLVPLVSFFFLGAGARPPSNRHTAPGVQAARVVNEVYHLHNKHQFPMVILDIAVATWSPPPFRFYPFLPLLSDGPSSPRRWWVGRACCRWRGAPWT
jgi:hypothetical protein